MIFFFSINVCRMYKWARAGSKRPNLYSPSNIFNQLLPFRCHCFPILAFPIFSSSCIPTSSLSSNSIPWSFFNYANPEIIELFPSLRVLEACLTFYNSNKKYGLQYWKVLSSIKQTYKNYNATIISYSFIHNNEKDSHSFDRIKTLDSCDLKRICDFFKRLLNLPDSFVVIGNA